MRKTPVIKEYQQLTEKQTLGYKQWIAELDEEAHEPGGNLSTCDPDVWQYFDPDSPIGCQVYMSYTDVELLDILIKTMDRPGRSPDYGRVYYIYKQYLRHRFGNLGTAKNFARTRIKRLREELQWPADWPERVSPEPLLEKLRQRNQQICKEDLRLLNRLCSEARETGQPPVISISVRDRLNRLYACKPALELMGIPALSQAGLRHMKRYWQVQREKQKAAEFPAVK